jgi:phage/plasmid-associated DNA primase
MNINGENKKIYPLTLIFDIRDIDEKKIRKIVSCVQAIIEMCFEITDRNLYAAATQNDDLVITFPKCPIMVKNMKSGSQFINTLEKVIMDLNEKWINKDNIYTLDLIANIDIDIEEHTLCYFNLDKHDLNKEDLPRPEKHDMIYDEDDMIDIVVPKILNRAEVSNIIKSELALEALNEEIINQKQMVKKILKILDKEKRFNNFDDFEKFLCCIFNCSSSLFDIVMEYLEGNPYINECEELWAYYIENGTNYEYGFNTLKAWAIEDNKEEAVKLFRSNVEFLIRACLDQGSSFKEIADVIKNMYADKYVCSDTSVRDGKWWVFEGTVWSELSNGLSQLREILNTKIRPKFKNLGAIEGNKRTENNGTTDLIKNKLDFMRDKCIQIHTQLGTPSAKSNVLKEAADLFFDREFQTKLNKYTNYVAFENTVFNCRTMEFEDGNPYHYLSRKCNYQMEDFGWKNEDVNWWFNKYINLVFPPDYCVYDQIFDNYYKNQYETNDYFIIGSRVYDKEGNQIYKTENKAYIIHNNEKYEFHYPTGKDCITDNNENIKDTDCTPVYSYRDYILLILSSALYEGCKEKKYLIFVGDTNNGKSVFNFILKNVMGDFYTDTPKSLILSYKRSTEGGATPGWFQIDGSKITALVEPDTNSTFNDSNFKLLTNGGLDNAEGRDLFMKGSDARNNKITPTCLGICFCNTPPKFDGSDKALQTRMLCCPLTTTWDEEAPLDPHLQLVERHYPRDEDFNEKCKKRIPQFMWILIQYYKKYFLLKQHNKLSIPEIIKVETQEYISRNDIIQMFMDDRIDIVPPYDDNGVKLLGSELKLHRKKYKILGATLFKEFTSWYDEKFKDREKIDNTSFVSMMKKKKVHFEKMFFYGIKLK